MKVQLVSGNLHVGYWNLPDLTQRPTFLVWNSRIFMFSGSNMNGDPLYMEQAQVHRIVTDAIDKQEDPNDTQS